MLKVNNTTHLSNGLPVSTGSLIEYKQCIMDLPIIDPDTGARTGEKIQIHYGLAVFKNETGYKAGDKNIEGEVNEYYSSYVYELSAQEYSDYKNQLNEFASPGVFATIEGYLITAIENGYQLDQTGTKAGVGGGNVVHHDVVF